MDFYNIKERSYKGVIEVYPDFIVGRSKDLMIRGKSFYAVWDEEAGMWSTDEYDVQRLVDNDLANYRKNMSTDQHVVVKYLRDYSSNMWTEFRNYVSHISDNAHQLDDKLIFANTDVKKTDYASKKLPYPLEKSSYDSYDEIIGTLYEPEERDKIEWAIGAIVSGEAKKIQKFLVLYGEAGAGKSTILNIIQMLFDGYYTSFEAKALTSSNNAFSTEVFKTNPLVGIQHDGDLSRIEDNTKLNSIVSHEEMTMNEKYKPSYTAKTNCFLFMATNRPVKITDAKSGVIRRLIDVRPSGNKIPPKRYQMLMDQIPFELGGIAYHCQERYFELGKNYYNSYRPVNMILQTDVFYNFVEANYTPFAEQEGVTLSSAYEMYKQYCDDSLVDFKLAKYKFREELKNYFKNFDEVTRVDGKQVRSYYSGFMKEKFTQLHYEKDSVEEDKTEPTLIFDSTESLFDSEASEYPAQLANKKETPSYTWSDVKTKLKDINTSKLHYVMVPLNHIVIDFDIKGPDGEKSFERNLEAASKWPLTYAELSKSGKGIHLHYIYDGDPTTLTRVIDENIEVKVFTGNSSLRRKLSKCNNVPIRHINAGIPTKEEIKMINWDGVKNEKAIRTMIKRNLNKEYHGYTKPSIDYIYKILEDAYNSDLKYDVTDLRPAIMAFANNSSHNSGYCLKVVSKMKFKSDDIIEQPEENPEDILVFYDCEVFPNLFLINWKRQGLDEPVVRMINPSPLEVEFLTKFKLIGFNCRRYDNHIVYSKILGYNNRELYQLSKRIIGKSDNCFFGGAYNLSYTDVYDFAAKKQSLKKWEIELGGLSYESLMKKGFSEEEIEIIKKGRHHKELGFKWDEPVPEEHWMEVAAYCDNDVLATEAVFTYLKGDWTARQILADIAGMTPNDTTNSLTTKIIFGNNRNPNLVYTDLATGQRTDGVYDPSSKFEGYEYKNGANMFRGEDVGRGGYVYANPGMYGRVITFDVASMHPSSIIAMNAFGDYTPRFKELLDARIAIKHGDFETARIMLNGAMAKYLEGEVPKDIQKALTQALKIAINSVYGLTSASFDNPFKDRRNVNNIVALRGALFMVTLRDEIIKRGGSVVHIKTDSIKIENPSEEMFNFVMDYGKQYGYNFEIEHIFEKICLVNNAVYIAKLAEDDPDDPCTWTATGAQFAVPYVFKTLFSHEPIEFKDLCETKNVNSAMYLDMNETLDSVSEYEKEYDKLNTKYKKALKEGSTDIANDLRDKMDQLKIDIQNGHNYVFVGKTGLYCPMLPGTGGGVLVRENNGSYAAVTGTDGWRWLESEQVETMGLEKDIDHGYYRKLVDEAIDKISEFGDFEMFAA